jgi:MuDR family transposase
VKGKILKWVVDSDRFSLCELISGLSEELCWGSCQTPKIWMFDKNEGRDVGVVSESQILEMFRMYQNEQKITLIVVVCDLDGSSKYSGSQSQIGGFQECNMSKQPDQSNNPDEHVGFNEKRLYGSDIEVGFANHAFEKEYIDPEEDNEHEELVVDEVEGDIHEELRINDVVQCEPSFVFDPENPKIEVNALFPDVNTFRKALRHFAIKNEFEVRKVKSDRKRFIGECKHPSCPWRIRASILQDNKTFMVCIHLLVIII